MFLSSGILNCRLNKQEKQLKLNCSEQKLVSTKHGKCHVCLLTYHQLGLADRQLISEFKLCTALKKSNFFNFGIVNKLILKISGLYEEELEREISNSVYFSS